MQTSQTKDCETHAGQQNSFICVEKGCWSPLCPKCISKHCQTHKETSKTFPNIKTIEEVREDLSGQVGNVLSFLYNELESVHFTASERVYNNINQLQGKIIEHIGDYFRKKEKQAEERLKELNQGSVIDTENSQIKLDLKKKIDEFEEFNNELNNGGIEFLIKNGQKDLNKEAAKVKEELGSQLEPIKVIVSDDIEKQITKILEQSIMIGAFSGEYIFGNNIKHEEIEISGEGYPITMKKKGDSMVGICLGQGFTSGIHTMVIKIEELNGGGWVGLGFVDHANMALNQSHYSQAICICSDQSFYGVTIETHGSVAAGITYTFVANMNTGELQYNSSEGFLAKSSANHKDKTLYPYFEFRGKHHITLLSYDKMD